MKHKDPKTLPAYERRAYDVVGGAFAILAREGYQPMDVNSFAMGMIRSSMEDLLGLEHAAQLDAEWRRSCNWAAPDTAAERDRLLVVNAELVGTLGDIARGTRPAPKFSQRPWEAKHNSAVELVRWVQNKARAALSNANATTEMDHG